MSTLKALIFDVDGTLAETEHDAHRVAFNRAFAESGLDWHWDTALYGKLLKFTTGKERIRYYAAQVKEMQFDTETELAEFAAAVHAIKTKHSSQILGSGAIPLRPGVARLISEAREAGLRLAIATTTTRVNAVALVEANLPDGAVDWFSVIGAADAVTAKKPAPDVYLYVLEQLDLPASQCLVFEDSDFGLASARAAGLTTVITTARYTRHHDFSGAALVLDHLGEPHEPFTVLAGQAYGKTYFDVDLARRLVQR